MSRTLVELDINKMIPRSFAYPGKKSRPAPSKAQAGILRHLVPAFHYLRQMESNYRYLLNEAIQNGEVDPLRKESALQGRKDLIDAEKEVRYWLEVARSRTKNGKHRGFNKIGNFDSCCFDSFQEDLNHALAVKNARSAAAFRSQVMEHPQHELIMHSAGQLPGGATLKNIKKAYASVLEGISEKM